MNALHKLAVVAAAAMLASCAANGTAQNPPVKPTNLQGTTALQMAIGTANIGQTSTVGINVVATFRQTNGNSAVLVDTPTFTGPAGFLVPNSAPPVDAGTNHISGAPQDLNPATAAAGTTFGQSGGVFSYGFGPFNITNTGGARYPGNPQVYAMPMYSGSTSSTANLRYVGGPPAYPFFTDGTQLAGFDGYSQGFLEVNAAPVAGMYTLSVATGGGNGNAAAQTFTASATLGTSTPAIGALALPTFTSDGLGGGSGTVVIPAGATETMIYVVDLGPAASPGAPVYFAVGPITGAAGSTQSYTLPDGLGPCSGTSCQTNPTKQQHTIPTGDAYRYYAASFDYPMFESSPPGNTTQKPVIAGANGQADISTSPRSATLTY